MSSHAPAGGGQPHSPKLPGSSVSADPTPCRRVFTSLDQLRELDGDWSPAHQAVLQHWIDGRRALLELPGMEQRARDYIEARIAALKLGMSAPRDFRPDRGAMDARALLRDWMCADAPHVVAHLCSPRSPIEVAVEIAARVCALQALLDAPYAPEIAALPAAPCEATSHPLAGAAAAGEPSGSSPGFGVCSGSTSAQGDAPTAACTPTLAGPVAGGSSLGSPAQGGHFTSRGA